MRVFLLIDLWFWMCGGKYLNRTIGSPILLFVIMQHIYAILLIMIMVARLTLNVGPFIHFYPTFAVLLVVYVISMILAVYTLYRPSKKVWWAWIIRWSLAFVFALAIIVSLNMFYIGPDPMPSMHPWNRMGSPWEAVFEIIMAVISLSVLVYLRPKFGFGG